MRWRLMYAAEVTRYLYRLRHAGADLHAGIKAIGSEEQPWSEDRAITHRPGRYERFTAGHWVVYEVEQEDRTIRIVAVQSQ